MRFIECNTDIEWFQDMLSESDSIWIPVFSSSHLHYVNNPVSLVYVYFIDKEERAVLPVNHLDALSIDMNAIGACSHSHNIFVYRKKWMPLWVPKESYDIELIYWLNNNSHLPIEKIREGYSSYLERWYSSVMSDNKIIPITKHIEYCDRLLELFLPEVKRFETDSVSDIYNGLVLDSLKILESNGICVNEKRFRQMFPKYPLRGNLVHSLYNIYTTTGRPSNNFGTVNFAALNKEDGSREVFVSRFDGGKLFEFDFDSFHLRLISQCVGYSFDEESIHEHFAKIYFQKDTIDADEYEVAKQITFKQVFGGTDPEYQDIELFKRVKDLTRNLWTTFITRGYIETPVFGRKLYASNFSDITNNKLFNYYLQALEFETGILVINEINEYLKQYNSKLVLYTYDSFLFDVDLAEGKNVLIGIYNILSSKYPVKVKAGTDYQHMKSLVMR